MLSLHKKVRFIGLVLHSISAVLTLYALEGNFRFVQDKSYLNSDSDKKFGRKATVALENKIFVLDFQNEALTYAIKPFDRRYETADLPYQTPTYDIKPLVLDVQNEPPTYDIKLFELNRQYRKYQTANLPYKAPIKENQAHRIRFSK